MAEIRLTPAQQAAVENRGGALLVSAAAGSGKTKVLVDRLLSYVEDENDPANIDEFLIITYTKAAASELRGKISAELSRRLAENPLNRHLQRQLTRIHLAQISTVHAFCAAMLRRYCTLRDLPPDFRVAEQTEANAIRLEVFQNTLEDFYRTREQRAEFQALADQLGFGRDDRRLISLCLSCYDEVRCRKENGGFGTGRLAAPRAGGIRDGYAARTKPMGRILDAGAGKRAVFCGKLSAKGGKAHRTRRDSGGKIRSAFRKESFAGAEAHAGDNLGRCL